MAEKWYETAGFGSDVIVSTRVRLARNVKGYSFSALLKPQALWEITEKVLGGMKLLEDSLHLHMRYVPLETMTPYEREKMVEQHLISPQFAKTDGAVMLSGDDSISIMIGEEDHLRLQVLRPGFDIENAYDKLNEIETALSSHIPFAFDDTLGYLTQCPTNLGCALRVSVMAHLPALEQSGALQAIIKSAHRLGLTVRGMYGEGSSARGSLYQISNDRSLGLSEGEILDNIKQLTEKIIAAEKKGRERFLLDAQAFEDRVWQAYGTLKYARLLSYKQVLNLLSTLRLGISLGVIDIISFDTLSKILNQTGAGAVCAAAQQELSPRQRDYERAKSIRKMLE